MDVKVYTQHGEPKGSIALPDKVFGLKWNADLVHQVVTSQMANLRQRIAKVKDRREVRGGGRKPWRQKGTGRARHGSIRSPLWKGGGVTHGPTPEKVFKRKVNKKMAARALATVLSAKARDHELVILEELALLQPKTREAAKVFESLAKAEGLKDIGGVKRRALVLLPEDAVLLRRAMRNLPNVALQESRNVTALELLNQKYVLLPKASIEVLTKRIQHV